MKKEWIAVLLLAAVIAASVFSQFRLHRLTDTLCRRSEETARAAELEDWESASALARDAADQWEKAHGYTHVFLRHGQIDDATDKLIALQSAVHARDPEGVFQARTDLCSAMRELCEMECLSLGSIL